MEIGYEQVKKINGNLHFAVNHNYGLKVHFLRQEKNLYTGKDYIKRHEINDYQVLQHKITGEYKRVYIVAIHCGDLEITLGDKKETIKNSYDSDKWF